MAEKNAIYAGTFDPVTFGHIDIIKRGSQLFDNLIIAVSQEGRNTLFDCQQRVELITEYLSSEDELTNCSVISFSGLLVDTMRSNNIRYAVRGVRSAAELYDEETMANMNAMLDENVETIIFFANTELSMISASLVREVARCNGDLNKFVPEVVQKALCNRFA